jgi:hypothetical protein
MKGVSGSFFWECYTAQILNREEPRMVQDTSADL